MLHHWLNADCFLLLLDQPCPQQRAVAEILQLPPHDGITPGQTVDIPFEIPLGRTGPFRLELDLVSEGVCSFEVNGSRPASVEIVVG